MDKIDWGNVPSWISAIVSVAAFVAASIAARAAWKQVKYTATDQSRRDSLREQEHASKVAAWAVPSFPQLGEIHYHYTNSGELPIFNLMITPVAAPQLRAAMHVVAPAGEVRHVVPERINDEIPSGLKFAGIPLNKEKRKTFYQISERVQEAVQSGVVIQFQDAAGQVWRRDQNGNLEKVDGYSDSIWRVCFAAADFGGKEISLSLPEGVEVEMFVDGSPEVYFELDSGTTPTRE